MKSMKYDSPEDITSVELKIQTVSGVLNPTIYANRLNQLPLEIVVKALKVNEQGEETILNFADETWLTLLNLRFAVTDKLLSREADSGWCFTRHVNNYSREVGPAGIGIRQDSGPSDLRGGEKIVVFYLYSTQPGRERIAVGLDTPGGKHFSTADSAEGAEKSSVSVVAGLPVRYRRSGLDLNWNKELGQTHVPMKYSWGGNGGSWSENISAHYDNLYITLASRYQIQDYAIHGYDENPEYPHRVAAYWTCHDDQHMLIADPPGDAPGEDTLGFEGKAGWRDASLSELVQVGYDMHLRFKYNEIPNAICWTHFSFAASEHWPLPDGTGLHVENTDIYEYTCDNWFSFHDIYGNYGEFSIRYNYDTQNIEVIQR